MIPKEAMIKKKSNPLKETFGILKLKKSTDELLKEIDKESWDKENEIQQSTRLNKSRFIR